MGQPDGQLVVLTQRHNDWLVVIKILSTRFWFILRALLVSQFPQGLNFLAIPWCCGIIRRKRGQKKEGGFGKGKGFKREREKKGKSKGGSASQTQHSKASPATSRIEPSPATSRIEPGELLKQVISIPFQKMKRKQHKPKNQTECRGSAL